MDNVPGTGRLITPTELAAILLRAAHEINDPRGMGPASDEGSIVWESRYPPDIPGPEEHMYEVLAFVRISNDRGQGGAIVINGNV
jgi:hypothetical protein